MKNKFGKSLEELRKLKLPDGQYAVYGSGPLAIRGIRKAHDLDVLVLGGLYQKLKEKHPLAVQKDSGGRFKERIKLGEVEIYPTWTWSSMEELERMVKRAELVKGIRFIRLKDLLECKKKMGRPKDIEDIKLIEEYLER